MPWEWRRGLRPPGAPLGRPRRHGARRLTGRAVPHRPARAGTGPRDEPVHPGPRRRRRRADRGQRRRGPRAHRRLRRPGRRQGDPRDRLPRPVGAGPRLPPSTPCTASRPRPASRKGPARAARPARRRADRVDRAEGADDGAARRRPRSCVTCSDEAWPALVVRRLEQDLAVATSAASGGRSASRWSTRHRGTRSSSTPWRPSRCSREGAGTMGRAEEVPRPRGYAGCTPSCTAGTCR